MRRKQVELAWAAGLFDGEGCAYVRHHRDRVRPYSYLCLMVVQCHDPAVLHRFHAAVGCGNVRGPYGDGERYEWSAQAAADVKRTVKLLWKHLSEPKRQQIARKHREAKVSR